MRQPGKWEEITFKIPTFSSSYTPLSSDFMITTETFCSKCGSMVLEAILHEYKYCPYCGDKKEDKSCCDCKYYDPINDRISFNCITCTGSNNHKNWEPREDQNEPSI